MHNLQYQMQRKGVIEKGCLSPTLKITDSEHIHVFHMLYHFLCSKEKKSSLDNNLKQSLYNKKRIIKLIELLERYEEKDVGILFISHQEKSEKELFHEITKKLISIIYKDEYLQSTIASDTAVIVISSVTKNMSQILDYSEDEYYLNVMTMNEVSIYSERESIYQQDINTDNNLYILGQLIGFSNSEFYMSHLIMRLKKENEVFEKKLLDILDTRFVQSLEKSLIEQNVFENTHRIKPIESTNIEKVMIHLFQQNDITPYLEMTVDIYYAFYMMERK